MKMHWYRLLTIVLVLFLGCQKEVTFENAGGSSRGRIHSIAGNCSPITVNGAYSVGIALTALNTITVRITVQQAGPYLVYTDTLNGIYFRASGTVNVAGDTSITLRGTGIPQVADTTFFTVHYDTTQCIVPVIVSSPASGILDCTGAIVNGTYAKNVALTTSNTVQVQANVTNPGSYTITTDTVHGIWFNATGNFASATPTPVVLNGFGTPDSAGTWTYRARFGTSSCTFNITVVNPSGGTLGGAPDTCRPATVNGTYVVGTALAAGNNVQVQATIPVAGPVSITTDTIAGMSFNFSGSLPAGSQTVTLAGSGTPSSAGSKTFTVRYGTSRCIFVVNVSAAVNNDLFPLTLNSWWSYDDPDQIFVSGDSLMRKALSTVPISGNTYTIIQNLDETTPIDSSYFRRSGNDYLERQQVDYYTAVFAFDNPQTADILFLKEGLVLNQTWESAVYTGTVGGSPAWLKYAFQCIAVNVTETINGKTFSNNVYKIAWRPKVSFDGTNYQDEFISLESWFARGVGMIQLKVIDLSGQQGPFSINILNWRVF